MLKTILKGETAPKSTTVDVSEKSVICAAVAQHKTTVAAARGLVIKWTFDYKNVPLEELYRRAAESDLITIRRSFQKCDDPEKWANTTIDANWIKAPGVKLSDDAKFNAKLETMSVEQLTAILEQKLKS
jgi:hypothetical protein